MHALLSLDRTLISLVEAIDAQRQIGLESLIRHLHTEYEQLRDEKGGHSFDCASTQLGALTKEMHASNLLFPRPSRPFLGYSVSELASVIRKFRQVRLENVCYPPRSVTNQRKPRTSRGCHKTSRPCFIASRMSSFVDKLERGLEGLCIDYLPMATSGC